MTGIAATPYARLLMRLIVTSPFVLLLMSHPERGVAQEAQSGEVRIDPNKLLVPGAKFEYFEYRRLTALSGDPLVKGVRQVGVVNGVHYRFNPNASGTFQGMWQEEDLGPIESDITRRPFRKNPLNAVEHTWDVFCKRDLMTDTKWCVIDRQDLYIRVYGKASNRHFDIKIGKDHYPGSTVALRVDKGTPITGNEGGFYGQAAKSVLKQLLSGTTIVTRYQEWPEKYYTEKVMGLRGLPEAIRYLEWVLDGQPGLPPKPIRKPGLRAQGQASTTTLEGTITSAANELIQTLQDEVKAGNGDTPLN